MMKESQLGKIGGKLGEDLLKGSWEFLQQIEAQAHAKGINLADIKSGNRQIKIKMLVKLTAWMEKLCLTTLEFSR